MKVERIDRMERVSQGAWVYALCPSRLCVVSPLSHPKKTRWSDQESVLLDTRLFDWILAKEDI